AVGLDPLDHLQVNPYRPRSPSISKTKFRRGWCEFRRKKFPKSYASPDMKVCRHFLWWTIGLTSTRSQTGDTKHSLIKAAIRRGSIGSSHLIKTERYCPGKKPWHCFAMRPDRRARKIGFRASTRRDKTIFP